MSTRSVPLLGAVLLATFASACGATRFNVTRRAPAEVDIPPGKVIAVAPIGGKRGSALATELSQALLATKRFQVLERQALGAAMQEIKLSADGHVSDESALSYGNMVGAGTLVVGEVAKETYEEDLSSAEEKCARDGKLVACVRNRRVGTANLDVALKVLETESGKLLAAKTLSTSRQRAVDAVDAPAPTLNAEDALAAECRAEVVERFIHMVAPYEKQVSVVLMETGDLPELETGNNYARIGNWASAVEQYRAALSRAEGAGMKPDVVAQAHYDLGVGLGYSGAYADGIAHLEKAYALDPSGLYAEQISVVRKLQEEDARLAAQDGAKKP